MENISDLAVKIYDINRCFQKLESATFRKYNLRNAHIIFLLQVNESENGLTPTEISDACGIDKAFISRLSSELFGAGIIKFNEKFDDGRKYKRRIVLSEKGEEIIGEFGSVAGGVLARLTDTFSDYDIKNFYKVLLALGEIMDEEARKQLPID